MPRVWTIWSQCVMSIIVILQDHCRVLECSPSSSLLSSNSSWAELIIFHIIEVKKMLQIKLPVLKHSSLQIYFHANHKKLSLEIYHFGKITNYPLLTKNFNKRAFQDILNSFCLKIMFQEIRENLPMMHLYKCPFSANLICHLCVSLATITTIKLCY